jgi:hypothetical protein
MGKYSEAFIAFSFLVALEPTLVTNNVTDGPLPYILRRLHTLG